MKKVLIIAPHPDDAELAMGGTIAKMINAGWDVTIADLTNGEPTPFGSEQKRKKETHNANKALGLKNRACLNLPNRYLQPTLENRRKLAEVIRLHQPDLLFGPLMPDLHPDHVATTNLINGARFEAKFHKTEMAGIPHWTPKQYGYYSTHRTLYDKPSFVVDITDCWAAKLNAIRAYQSQIKNTPRCNNIPLVEKVKIICSYFGQCAGVKYAEPFISYEPVSSKNLEIFG